MTAANDPPNWLAAVVAIGKLEQRMEDHQKSDDANFERSFLQIHGMEERLVKSIGEITKGLKEVDASIQHINLSRATEAGQKKGLLSLGRAAEILVTIAASTITAIGTVKAMGVPVPPH